MKYILDLNGVTIYTDEQFESIPTEAFTTSLSEIKEGMSFVMTPEHISFYLSHSDYDLDHLFNMTEYSTQELENKRNATNEKIELIRKGKYEEVADPLYMGYVKNMALGNDEKATEYYNQWLEAISSIKEQNPYIV